jgi:hypothetical protein
MSMPVAYFDAIRKTRGKRIGEGMAIHIGVDIGGTGWIRYAKSLTTHRGGPAYRELAFA